MKVILLSLLIAIATFSINCNKNSNELSLKLRALQGTWQIKSSKCYQGSIGMAYYPDAYYKFNSDLTGFIYYGTISNQYCNFTYNLLNDDSTLITQFSCFGTNHLDTSVITVLTDTELIYHGKNTYTRGFFLCTNGNRLDSLYR